MRHRTVVAVVVVLLVAVLPVGATQVARLNLEQMTERAERIVAGRCVAVDEIDAPEPGLSLRVITLEVDRAVKGAAAPTVTVKTIAGIAGMPDVRPGDEVVLFLYGESRLGVTSPVGLGQGAFNVVRDKQGRRVAVNRFANRGLFDGLTLEARSRLEPHAAPASPAAALSADDLLDMTDALAAARGAGR